MKKNKNKKAKDLTWEGFNNIQENDFNINWEEDVENIPKFDDKLPPFIQKKDTTPNQIELATQYHNETINVLKKQNKLLKKLIKVIQK